MNDESTDESATSQLRLPLLKQEFEVGRVLRIYWIDQSITITSHLYYYHRLWLPEFNWFSICVMRSNTALTLAIAALGLGRRSAATLSRILPMPIQIPSISTKFPSIFSNEIRNWETISTRIGQESAYLAPGWDFSQRQLAHLRYERVPMKWYWYHWRSP